MMHPNAHCGAGPAQSATSGISKEWPSCEACAVSEIPFLVGSIHITQRVASEPGQNKIYNQPIS
jgi:hypothetical protein